MQPSPTASVRSISTLLPSLRDGERPKGCGREAGVVGGAHL